MDSATSLLIVIVLAIIIVAFISVFRAKGKINVEAPGGFKASAEGENAPPPSAIAKGVVAEDIEGNNVKVVSRVSEGGTQVKGVKASGDVDISHDPGNSPK